MTLYHELLHSLCTFIFFLVIKINLESEGFVLIRTGSMKL